MCKQDYNYKWKVMNNFVVVDSTQASLCSWKCQNQRKNEPRAGLDGFGGRMPEGGLPAS